MTAANVRANGATLAVAVGASAGGVEALTYNCHRRTAKCAMHLHRTEFRRPETTSCEALSNAPRKESGHRAGSQTRRSGHDRRALVVKVLGRRPSQAPTAVGGRLDDQP